MEQPKNSAPDAAVLLGISNPYATKQPFLFYERQQSIAANRHSPTTKRERLLQELAIAVCDEWELRQGIDELVLKPELAQATQSWQTATQIATQATYDAEHPIEAAFDKVDNTLAPVYRLNPGLKSQRVVAWAIKKGILPTGTTTLPDVQIQYLLLARHEPTSSGTTDEP